MTRMTDQPRRRERTTDPQRLANHLGASIQEIADGAYHVDKGDPNRTANALSALKHQLANMAAQVEEHRLAVLEGLHFGEPAEFDVVAERADAGQPVQARPEC